MLTQFRICYPKGSLISELLTIDHGKYVVRVLVDVEGVTLATGLAAADTIEASEDRARNRALAVLAFNPTATTPAIPDSKVSEIQAPIAPSSQPIDTHPLKPIAAKESEKIFSESLEESVRIQEEQPSPSLQPPSLPETQKALTVSPETPPSSKAPGFSWAETQLSEMEAAPVTTEGESTRSFLDEPSFSDATKSVPEEEALPLELALEPAFSEPMAAENLLETEISQPVDFSEIIAKTNVELKRLSWTNEQGRDYLLRTYGKKSRQLLADEELLEFLEYLESQPTPSQ